MKSRAVHVRYGIYGLVFGFALSRMGFADYAQVHAMFVFADVRLLLTFCGGVGLSMMAFLLLHQRGALPPRAIHPGSVLGGVLFGAGWAITGACPAVVLVQLGQGQLAAFASLFGVIAGTIAYAPLHRRMLPWPMESCAV